MEPNKKSEFRELKPGKTLYIGARAYKGSSIKLTKDKKGNEKKDISISSTCQIPKILVEAYSLKEELFISVSGSPVATVSKEKKMVEGKSGSPAEKAR